MLECINRECMFCKEGKCESGVTDEKCVRRYLSDINYKEEYQKLKLENENRCYNGKCQHNAVNRCGVFEKDLVCKSRIKEQINYEEEYHKLKKENEELKTKLEFRINEVTEERTKVFNRDKEINKLLEEKDKEQEERIEIQKKRIRELTVENEGFQQGIEGYKERIKSYEKEIDSLKLKASVTEKLEIEINNLNVIIDGKDKRINELSNEILHIKAINGGLNDKIETIDDEYQEEIKELKESIKKGIESVKEARVALENKNKQIELFKQQHEEEQREKLLRQKENIDLKNAVKALASLL